MLDLQAEHVSAPLLFMDVTVRHGVPGDTARLRAAAATDGAVASEAEGDKRRRYPSEGVPFRCIPLAMETYGRLGPAALRHLRWLARGVGASGPASGDTSEWVAHAQVQAWGARLSVALHKANARNLRSAVGLAGPPSRFAEVLVDLLGQA